MPSQNLFQQYAQPARSVADYMGDADARDMRAAQLANVQRTNALADLAYSGQVEDTRQKSADRVALQRAAAASGGDENKLVALLRASGSAGLMAQADTLEKGAIERTKGTATARKDNADAGKTEYQTRVDKANKAITDIAALTSPQEAIDGLAAHLRAGDIDQQKHDAVLRTIPQDPTQFPTWRRNMLLNILSAKEQIEATKPVLGTTNLGGSTQYVARDPVTGAVTVNSSAPNTQSPDNAATTATARRGQDLTDSRQRELNAITREGQQTQVVNDPNQGIMLVNKGTKVAVPAVGADGKPIPSENAAKRASGSKSALATLDEADKLIDSATGSYVGTGADAVAQTFGKATEGAKAIAKLKVLQANLMMNQPRMEGPQSDRDVQLYREAAGQLGDPAVPRDIKKAALAAIRQIHERYAGVGPAAPGAPATPSVSNW